MRRKRRGPIRPPRGRAVGTASRGRVAREQVEVAAQGTAVLGHLLAAVELRARGVALTLLDERVHLQRQKPTVPRLSLWAREAGWR